MTEDDGSAVQMNTLSSEEIQAIIALKKNLALILAARKEELLARIEETLIELESIKILAVVIGDIVEKYCKAHKCKQKSVAKLVGVEPSTLTQWKKGDRTPDIQSLLCFEALGVDVFVLIEYHSLHNRYKETISILKELLSKPSLLETPQAPTFLFETIARIPEPPIAEFDF